MRLLLLTLLLSLIGSGVGFGQETTETPPVEFALPGRVLVLEKALIKLREQGADLSYRPDQLPQITVKVPGGKRSLGAWLSFLLRDTELTYSRASAGYLVYPDPELPKRMLSISGTVMDAESGERLIGAAVQIPDENRGTLSNEYGFYSLPVNGGSRKLRVTYVGYRPLELDLVVTRDTSLKLALQTNAALPSVIVRAVQSEVNDDLHRTDTRNSVGPEESDRIGGFGGQADPLRLARLLPGVESGADGVGGIFIRGSESGHNLVLLDGVPVYNLSHAAGIFSIFNNQAIRRLDLYKDGLPAHFGGRIGGVLDVHTRDGNLYEHEVSVGSNLLAAEVTAEGPLREGQSSYLVAGRYFWGGQLLGSASERYKTDRGRDGKINYDLYDVNLKLNHQLSERGRVYLSLFRAVDNYSNGSFATDSVGVITPSGAAFAYVNPRRRFESVAWTNTVAALRYNHVFSNRFFGNFRLNLSDLRVNAAFERSDSLNELSSGINTGDVFSARYGSEISQYGLAFDGQYSLLNGSRLRFGVEANQHAFTPLLSSGSIPLSFHPELSSLTEEQRLRPTELVAYGSFAGRYRGIDYRAGLRARLWRSDRSFINFSPRLLLAGQFTEKAAWRAAFDRSFQAVHLVSSTVIGLPSDIWVPAMAGIEPSRSDQVSFTFSQRIAERNQLEIATYYRDLRNLVILREGSNQLDWINNLSTGRGFTRGLEVSLSRSVARFRGWVNYTWSESRRQFDDEINFGRPFDFRFGRTHGLKLAGIYQLSPTTSLAVTWRYGTGANYSLSQESFLFVNPAAVTTDDQLQTINLIRERNGFRLPANHRLDVNAQFEFGNKPGRRTTHFLDVGIYNLYSRHNPLLFDVQTQYLARDNQLIADREFVQIFLAPITPTLAYRIKFGQTRNP